MPLDKQHTAGKQVVFQSIPSAPRIHHYYHPVFTITIHYHSLLLHHPPAAVGILFSGAEKHVHQPTVVAS
jgi:hypothetical protein